MLGQTHHFGLYAPEKIAYAIDRYSNEARRLYAVMDKRLASQSHIATDECTIADIAIFPWLPSWKNQGIDWADYPRLKDWFDRVAARPAARRGVEVLAGLRKSLRDAKAREILFGARNISAAEKRDQARAPGGALDVQLCRPSSILAIALRCTSSGPSAKRSVRAPA